MSEGFSAPPRDAPLRVRDGLISALGHRPVWSFRIRGGLVDDAGAPALGAAQLVEWLAAGGKRVIALGPSDLALPAPLDRWAEVQDDGSFRDLLDDLDILPAELVHVGPDRQRDVTAALKAGVRAVWLTTSGQRPGRGVLGVTDLAQLEGLLSGERREVRSGSTYHEI